MGWDGFWKRATDRQPDSIVSRHTRGVWVALHVWGYDEYEQKHMANQYLGDRGISVCPPCLTMRVIKLSELSVTITHD